MGDESSDSKVHTKKAKEKKNRNRLDFIEQVHEQCYLQHCSHLLASTSAIFYFQIIHNGLTDFQESDNIYHIIKNMRTKIEKWNINDIHKYKS